MNVRPIIPFAHIVLVAAVYLFLNVYLTFAQQLELVVETGHTDTVWSGAFSPNGKTLASGSSDNTIKLWDVETGRELKTLTGHTKSVSSVTFSPNSKTLASGSFDDTIKLWDVETGRELKTLTKHTKSAHSGVNSVTFSPNGKTLTSGSQDATIKLWDVETGRELKTLTSASNGSSVAFSPDGRTLASEDRNFNITLSDVESGKLIKSFSKYDPNTAREISAVVPDFYENIIGEPITPDGKFQIKEGTNNKLDLYDVKSGKILASLFALDENNWVVTTPEGRFDTNKSLERIEGLHWVVNDEILRPSPLDVFMRQYYEPGLLQRVLKCNEENNCGKEFKPLPSIAEINRVQPKVVIKEIKPNSADLADVTIEIESVTEDVSISATNRNKKKQLSSGAFDLRLFRDGQLVGVSAPKEKLEKFIADAPRLVAETRASGKLINTPEDAAWREANDVFAFAGENVKRISPTKIQYTFRNVKLPKDGREAVEFTAYAFNADKVKSTTTAPVKFAIPNVGRNKSEKGRAVVVSIGVNASENQSYNLLYAANDARKMQEIIGKKLRADAGKYSEIVQIPLVSDGATDKHPAVNDARKAIIKGVFSLLAGNEKEIPAEILKQIPNREKIKAIEPEDTLIITFAGHGYADNAGIFYLLPFDVGAKTNLKTAESLGKTISSDELSLWMQDVTAAEMLFVIDACHSSAAVQGDGFKPDPMGSRGLGQLAYDKDMKILSATQADNVALELGSLQQGLLSYALLEDGIVKSLADADKNQELLSAEWLSFAEKRVPELYREVKAGKHAVIIDGKRIAADGKPRAEFAGAVGTQKSNLNLQQPSLFDFKRRNTKNVLFTLPLSK